MTDKDQAARIRELELELEIARMRKNIRLDATPTTGQAAGAGFGAAFGVAMGQAAAGCIVPIALLVGILLLCALSTGSKEAWIFVAAVVALPVVILVASRIK